MIDGIAMYALVWAACILMAACAAIAFYPYISSILSDIHRRFMELDSVGKAIVSFAVCLCVMYGGSKSIMSKTGHDDTIGIVDAQYAAGGATTNVVPQSLITSFGHGTNIVAYSFSATNILMTASELASKIWYREDNTEQWKNFADTSSFPAGLQKDQTWDLNGPTTTVYYVFGPTNSWEHKQIYVGDDLPPVYIETEGGIVFDSLVMTSSKATITYTVEAEALTGPGVVVFERMWKGGNWESIRTVEAVAGQHVAVFPGFLVDRRSMWRLRLQVEVSE